MFIVFLSSLSIQFSMVPSTQPREKESVRKHYLIVNISDMKLLNEGRGVNIVNIASGLERRWYGIWVRSLEWQCLLELHQ